MASKCTEFKFIFNLSYPYDSCQKFTDILIEQKCSWTVQKNIVAHKL